MNNKTIFFDGFFNGLTGAGLYNRLEFKHTTIVIDPVRVPPRQTFSDDWAKIGQDFKDTIKAYEKTTKPQ